MSPVEVAGTISTFGQQPVSTRPTEPRTKIGTSTRTDKLTGGQFVMKLLGGTSKGVTTEVSSAFGNQPNSRAQSAPSYRVVMKTNPDEDFLHKAANLKESPGAGSYMVRATNAGPVPAGYMQFGGRFKLDHEAGESKQGLPESPGTVPRYGNPGPGAYAPPRLAADSVGRQTLSINPTAPFTRVGTENRFGHFKDNFATPSPGAWRPTSGWLGDAPTYSFHGQGRRADVARGLPGNVSTALADPGPGTYEAPSSLFNQASSMKPTAARTRVGTADREGQRRVFVTKGHERESIGAHSPSPAVYSPNQAASSKVRQASSWKFGSGDRFSEVKSHNGRNLKILTPGPGSYVV